MISSAADPVPPADPLPAGSVPGRYAVLRPADDRLVCQLCPRGCALQEGQRGLCFIRARQGGRMVLTSYGRSSGFCIDPIEKKPLAHFLPGTPVLSFGTAGCNLTCVFCQNWDISKSRQMDRLADAATPEQIARAAQRWGCRSVAFTYNDPVIFLEYAEDVAAACHAVGVQTVAVTAGYINPEPRQAFFRQMDAANVDLKGFREDFYQRLTGGHLAPVLDTLIWLRHETRVWLEITTLLIPGANDSAAELSDLCAWIMSNLGPDVPLHFSAFHPDYRMVDRPATPPATLARARQIARAHGLHHVYTGNIPDPGRGVTLCPACGERLIARQGYVLSFWNLTPAAACPTCGARLAGVFESRPGTWGARRVPVRMADFA